ncbi:MAG: phosphatase PAP2 family protein [Clostridiales bacterium]|nr:phosphatase PAP2 family protein [Clostridiales bacterium]
MGKYKKEIIIGSVAVLLFIAVAILTFAVGIQNVDISVYNFISSIRGDATNAFFATFTHIAGKFVTIGMVIIFAFLLLNRDKSSYKQYVRNEKWNNFINLIMPWLIFALSVLLVTILFFVIKAVFARPRPVDWFLVDEDGFSFPSGHTSTAVAMFGAIALLVHNSTNKKWVKYTMWTVCALTIILVGVSRIFLGVHYFTDVVAGLLLGVVVLCIASIVIKATKTRIYLRKINKE